MIGVSLSFVLYVWQQQIVSLSNMIADEHGSRAVSAAEVVLASALERHIGVLRLLRQNVLWLLPAIGMEADDSIVNSLDVNMPESVIDVTRNIKHHFPLVEWASVGFESGAMATSGRFQNSTNAMITEIVDNSTTVQDRKVRKG